MPQPVRKPGEQEAAEAKRRSLYEWLGGKAQDFAAGMSGVPGSPYGEAMNSVVAAGRSALGPETYRQALQQIRESREEQYPGAYSVVPDVRGDAQTQAQQEDMTANAVGMAAPIRTVGPRFNPTLFHGGIDPVPFPDVTVPGNKEYGQGFYTTPSKSMAEEYALQHEAPTAAVSEYRLEPGSRVFETTYKPGDALPSDFKTIKNWLGEMSDDVRLSETSLPPSVVRAQIDNPLSPDWIDAVNSYATAHGIGTSSYGRKPGRVAEYVTRDPKALKFKKSHKVE